MTPNPTPTIAPAGDAAATVGELNARIAEWVHDGPQRRLVLSRGRDGAVRVEAFDRLDSEVAEPGAAEHRDASEAIGYALDDWAAEEERDRVARVEPDTALPIEYGLMVKGF